MGVGWGAGILSLILFFCEFEYSLVWEFKLFGEFSLFWEFCEIRKIHEITARGLTANQASGGEKIVLYIGWFAYLLLSLLVALLLVLVVLFPLLPY